MQLELCQVGSNQVDLTPMGIILDVPSTTIPGDTEIFSDNELRHAVECHIGRHSHMDMEIAWEDDLVGCITLYSTEFDMKVPVFQLIRV